MDGIVKFLDKAKDPVPNRLLQYYVWRTKPHRFDAAALFNEMLKDGRAVYLSSGVWIGPKAAEKLRGFWLYIRTRGR